jgi:F-type H+-transporting ATPase subunit epsilon
MNRKINCSILTPEKIIFEGDVQFAVVQAFDGEMGFLFNHSPLISELGIGEIRLRDVQTLYQFYVEGGVVEIHDNIMIILAERAFKKEDLSKAQLEAKMKEINTAQTQKYSKDWMTLQIEEKKVKAQIKILSR